MDALTRRNAPWTASLALDLLPDTNGPRIEVLRGAVVVSPDGDYRQRAVQRELTHRVAQAARRCGLWAYRSVNIVAGHDLFIPHLAVLRRPGRGELAVPVTEAVLLAEITSPRMTVEPFDRVAEYRASAVPFHLHVDLRDGGVDVVLSKLSDGAYEPTVSAAAGTTFVMREPFALSFDPADLLDDEDAQDPDTEG
ncbi:Uma2 family endonuclease [Micromonospora halophytica]|uniref:Putative restriction endonuclease n=1 Tax=Micromonospora halophytica TaxID=47864 RepID=A0A1C5JP66_9ACTN|nr:Uma2 family endonuclease [Micromonospora halophytica]SCG71796.1 Putative restriction endonuclease [Micromonospora halophytica]